MSALFPHQLLGLFILSIVIFALLLMAYDTSARMRLLRERGYAWVRWRDAWRINQSLPAAVSRIPDVGTLERYGFDGTGADSLIEALRKYDRGTSAIIEKSFGRMVGFLIFLGFHVSNLTRVIWGGGAALGVVAAAAGIGFFLFLYIRQPMTMMRNRGYAWTRADDAWYLRRKLGRRFRNIPPRDHLLVTPGFRDYDPASIVERMNAIGATDPPVSLLQGRP